MTDQARRIVRGLKLTHVPLLTTILCLLASAAPAQDSTGPAQRAEELRAQLREVGDREAALQARLVQLDEELKPENIRNRTALIGTLDAEQLRGQVRRQLEGERERVRQQLDQLTASRSRLESAISRAELEEARRSAEAPATNDPAAAGAGEQTRATAVPAAPAAPPRRRAVRRPKRRTARARRKG